MKQTPFLKVKIYSKIQNYILEVVWYFALYFKLSKQSKVESSRSAQDA